MRKMTKALKQSLSILLAAVMVVTSAPQTATSVLAAEADAVEAQAAETAEDTAAVTEDTAAVETGDTEAVTEEGGSAEGSDEAAAGDTETVTEDETADAEDQDAAETVTDDEAVVEDAEASADEEAAEPDKAEQDVAYNVGSWTAGSEDKLQRITTWDFAKNNDSIKLSDSEAKWGIKATASGNKSSVTAKSGILSIGNNATSSSDGDYATAKILLDNNTTSAKIKIYMSSISSGRYLEIGKDDKNKKVYHKTTENETSLEAGGKDAQDMYSAEVTLDSEYFAESDSEKYIQIKSVFISGNSNESKINKLELTEYREPAADEWSISAIDAKVFNGDDQKPASVTVNAGESAVDTSKYDVKYYLDSAEVQECKNVGTYTVKVIGKDSDSDKNAETTFEIKPFTLKDGDVTVSDLKDNKFEIKVSAKLKSDVETKTDLNADTDYEVAYKKADNSDITEDEFASYNGTLKVVVTGKGNYEGTVTVDKTIGDPGKVVLTKELKVSEMDAEDLTADKCDNLLGSIFSAVLKGAEDSGDEVKVDTNNKTNEDKSVSFSKRLKTGGTGSKDARAIKFTVDATGELTVYVMSANSTETSNVVLSNGTNETVIAETAQASGSQLNAVKADISAAGTYYLYTNTGKGLNFYYLSFEEKAVTPETKTAEFAQEPALSKKTSVYVGDVLTVSYALKEGEDNSDIAWYRVKDGSETLINGATAKEYTVIKEDEGSQIKVTVTPKATGYNDGTAKSDTTTETVKSKGTTPTPGDDDRDDGAAIQISPIEPQTYTGKAIKPAVVVTSTGGVALKAGKDYTISYENNTNANADSDGNPVGKPAKVVIKGKGNYDKDTSVTEEFLIKQVSIANEDGDGFSPAVTAKANQAPIPTAKGVKVLSSLKYKNALKPGVDFNVTLKNDTDGVTDDTQGVGSSKGWPTVTEAGNYTLTVTAAEGSNYDGEVKLAITAADKDHSMSKAKVTLGKNIKKLPFFRIVTDRDGKWSFTDGEQYYPFAATGKADDCFFVKMGKDVVDPGAYDYDIVFSNGSKDTPAVGKAQLVITAKDGNEKGYAGSRSIAITVVGETVSGKSSSPLKVEGVTDKTYTGNPVVQDDLKVVYSSDGDEFTSDLYKAEYKNNIKKGTATVTVTPYATTGYTGTIKTTFKINPADISATGDDEVVTKTGMTDGKFDGSFVLRKAGVQPDAEMGDAFALTNEISGLKLVKGTDYTVSYKNNKAAGTGTATIKGKGNYTGTLDVTFDIRQASLKEMEEMLTISAKPTLYKANAKKVTNPKITVLDGKKALKGSGRNAEYEVVGYYNGDATELSLEGIGRYLGAEGTEADRPYATIKGAGAYASEEGVDGTITVPLSFYTNDTKLTSKNTTVTLNGGEPVIYADGAQLMPEVELSFGGRVLEEDDYALTYGANNKAGKKKGSVKIEGRGRYGGSFTYKFDIDPEPIDNSANSDRINKVLDELVEEYMKECIDIITKKLSDFSSVQYADNKASVTIADSSRNKNAVAAINAMFDSFKNDPDIKAEGEKLIAAVKEKLGGDIENMNKVTFIVTLKKTLADGTEAKLAKPKTVTDPSKFLDDSVDTLISAAQEFFNDVMADEGKDYADKTLASVIGTSISIDATCTNKDSSTTNLDGYEVEFK